MANFSFPRLTPFIHPAIYALAVLCGTNAWAETSGATPMGIVAINSSAVQKVGNDVLSITLQGRAQGNDAQQVQSQLKTALETALQLAKPLAKPEQLEIQTGGLSLSPRYNNQGLIVGWSGSTQLMLSGQDQAGIAKLAGRINTLSVSSVQQSVSRQARDRVEGQVTEEALKRFQARAQQVTRTLGQAHYKIREITVSSAEGGGQPPTAPMMMRAASMEKSADVPVEMGVSEVSVNVSGTIQMQP